MKSFFTFRLFALTFILMLTANLVAAQITEDFITTWEVTEDDLTVSISRWTELEYNYSIDWGDGNKQSAQTGSPEHTYSSAGTYTVKISGISFPGFRLIHEAIRQIRTVEQWGDNRWETFEDAFKNCSFLVINATDAPNLGSVRSMDSMFEGAGRLTGDFSDWNTGQVTSMESMFQNTTGFNGDLGNWDVGNVTNMRGMFNDALSFNSDLSNWDVSNVTDMSFMFNSATVFNSDLNDWDVSKVTDMEFMFNNTEAFNSDLDGWDTGNVTIVTNMFDGATAFDGNLSNWDLTKVTSLEKMFFQATAFNGDVSGWKVQNVTDMKTMFQEAAAFDQPMNDWDVSSVTDMTNMFFEATSFNQNLDNWNTESLTTVTSLFEGATSFNGNVSTWDVSKISSTKQMFRGAVAFNSDISAWKPSNLTDMSFMFDGATAFNADISGWNLSGRVNMTGVFSDLPNFNQPIGKWNIELVGAGTFANASSFDQNLSNWNLESATVLGGIFVNSGMSTKNYNATLFGWSQQSLRTGVTLSADGLEYCNIGEEARQKIIDDFGWTFSGDSKIECTPILFAGVKDSDTQLTVVFDTDVTTNGGNPKDFDVRDAFDNSFAVSAQSDGTAGDSLIVLTIADISSSVGDLTVTYTNNNTEIKDFAFNQLVAATSSVVVDTDTEAPQLVSAVKDSDTQITLTFNEPVQTQGGGLFAFTVTDDNENDFEVTAQVDGTARDNKIVMTVADMSSAVGLLNFNYVSNLQIADFGGNALEDASALICADGFTCNLIAKTLCTEESYTLNGGQIVINPEQLVHVDTVGTVITQYRFTIDESIDCCPDGFTCDIIDLNSCEFPYTSPLGNTTSEEGRVIDVDNANQIRNTYNVTFNRAEVTSDVFQNAIIADAGSVTYQANTNATGVLSFDKSQDYWVNMNALQDELSSTNRSIFMWVKSEANVTSTHQTLFAINTASGGNVSLLWIDDDSDNLEVNDGSTNQSASFNMNGEVWNYVGYTYDATTNETVVYVNGIENDRYTNNQIAAVDAQYSLGQEFDNSSTGNFYNGDMAEISVWNEVLTGAEIQTAMQAKINNGHPKFANLVGYYSVFGECTDDVAILKDHSGNGNDGTFENGMVQDFQNVQNVEGFNSIGWYDVLSWKKDGEEVATTSTFTTDVAAGNYQFTANRNFVQSTDVWTMTGNTNAADVDNLADEIICDDGPITRTVAATAVNYLDFEETEDNSIEVNPLAGALAGKSRSVFMWLNKESSIGSGDFNEVLVFQSSDVDDLSRFYLRDTERLALWDGTNDRLNSSALTNDTWYFVGYTYDQTTGEAKLYLNGTEEDSGILDMPLGAGWFATLGAKYNDNGLEDHLDGKLAEITIWDKVLSQEEVTSLMGAAPANDAGNLVAAYGTLKSTADNQLRDLTANANDGLASHNTIIVNSLDETIHDYDASANYIYSWKKAGTEFDTDATGNITIDEGTTAYSVTYGTPLFQKTDDFSLIYTNLIPTQPVSKTAGAQGSVTFEVDEIAGASYQWFEENDDWTFVTANENGFAATNAINAVAGEGEKIYVGTDSEGISISKDGGTNWVTTTSGQNGFANDNDITALFAIRDTIAYAGTDDAGLSISENGGTSWTTVTKGQNGYASSDRVNSIYGKDKKIYVGTAGGLSISTDAGDNWTTTTSDQNGFASSNSVQAVFAEGDHIYAGTFKGLSISTDGGANWVTTSAGQNGFASTSIITSVAAVGNQVYVGTSGGGISISNDGGLNWTTTTRNQNGFANSDSASSIYILGGNLYVATIGGGLSISTDGGLSWTTTNSLNDFGNARNLSSVYAEGDFIYAGTTQGFAKLQTRILLVDNADAAVNDQIQGATTSQLSINNLSLDQNGNRYFVEVTLGDCTDASNNAILTVLDVPAVLNYSPDNGSTDNATDTELSMEFSKTVTAGTGELKIFNYATDALVQTFTAGDLTIDGSTVSISSGISLEFSSQYYITLDANLVKDGSDAGNLAVTDKDTWSFHTVCEPLVLTQPEDQSGFVAGSATFSVPEVAGASYQWFNSQNITEEIYDFSGLIITDIYANESRIHVTTDFDKLFTSIDGGISFTENEKITGKARKVIEFDGVMYVATLNAGLAISTDNGATFEYKNKANNGLANDNINSIYVNSGILYVSTNSGLSISTDNGESFETRTTNDGLGNNTVHEVYVVGSTVYVANLIGGFGISQDGGKTFTSKGGGNGLTGAISELVVASDGTIYVGGASAFVSKDGGESFTEFPAAEQFLSTQVFDLDIEDDILYINVQEESLGAAVYSSADKGNTLTTLSQTDASGYRERTISVLNGQVFAGGYSGTLVKHLGPTALKSGTDATADNYLLGATTATLTFSNLTEDLDQSHYFVVVTKGDCEETSDTVTLSVTCEPLILTQPTDQTGTVGSSVTFSVPEVAGASYQWYQPGGSWGDFPDHRDDFGQNSRVYVDSDKIYIASNGGGLFISEDNGRSWTNPKVGVGGFPNNSVRSVFAIGETVYVGTFGGIGISTDGGANWTTTTGGQNGFATSDRVNDVFVSDNHIYAATDAGISISTDGGASWTTSTTIGLSGTQEFLAVYAVGDYIYAGGTDTGLVISANNGTSWSVVDSSVQGFASSNIINAIRAEGTSVYVGTEQGLTISHDKGSTWNTITASEIMDATGFNKIYTIDIFDGSIYAGHTSGLSISSNQGADWERGPSTPLFTSSQFKYVSVAEGVIYGVTLDGVRVLSDRIALSNDADAETTDGVNGSSTHQLTIANTTEALDQGEYFVVVTKGDCEETSNIANLSVITGPPSTAPFTLMVTTTEANEEFTIPSKEGLTYNYYIDWGDGEMAAGRTGSETHTYAVAGSYDVKIYGTFPAIDFSANTTNARRVVDIKTWGEIAWQTMNGAFAETNLTTLSATDTPDLSGVTDLSEVFEGTRFFNSDLSSWNVSTITNMKEVFRNAPKFNGDISNWDVSNVTTMERMFQDADAFNQDISGWKVNNVTNMADMFNSAQVFDQDISGWNVGKVTTMSGMFLNARVFNQDISGWDVSKVTTMSSMFGSARLFDQDISGWNVGAVTSMSSMFISAFKFNQDLSSWNVENVMSMIKMFKNASVFNQDLSGWDVSNVTNMSEMFTDAALFNGDVSGWDVSASLDFNEMFKDAAKFDQNLGAWNIKAALEDDSEALGDIFDGTALSTTNYDNTLIGWAAIDGLPDEAYLYDVPATFCQSESQRDFLLNTLSWEIDDEGKATNCFAAPAAVTLNSFVPANGATEVAVTSNIALTFSENVQAYVYGEGGTTVNDAVLYDATDTEVQRFPANTLTYSAATVTIDPTADLDYSQTYYLLVEADALVANTNAKFAGVTDVNAIRFTTEAQPNIAPVASAQDFTGTLEVNQSLTGSYTYTDADTDAESGTTFQWYVADDAAGANSMAISGATSQNYTLTTSDVGKFVALAIIPNDGTDEGTEVFTFYKGAVAAAVIPTLESTDPVDGAIDVSITKDLSFVLSEEVTKGTGNVTITPASGAATVVDVTSADVTVSGTNVTVNPITDLLSGQFYTVTYDASAFLDADGNNSAGLASQTVWNFTTIEPNVAPVAQGVNIKQSIVVTEVLEGSYTFFDDNGDTESGTTYQWYRADDASGTGKTAISGATSQNYTAVNEDNGKFLSFEVTPNDGSLAGTAVESNAFGPVLIDDGVTNIPPAFTSDALTSLLDNANYSYTINFEDRNSDVPTLTKTTGPAWLSVSGFDLTGTPGAANIGDHVVVLTLDDQNGGTVTQEFTVTVLASNVAPSVNGIEIAGTTTIDEQLTGNYNFVDEDGDADNSTYKWYRADDASGTAKVAISGATTTTYTLTANDAGKHISFEVTPNDGTVDGTMDESTAVGEVAKKVPSLALSAISKTYGDADLDLAATTNSSGAITYSFDSDPTSASLSGATVTLGNVGEITVDIALAEDAEFQSRAVQGTITIAKRIVEVTATDASKNVGANDPTLEFTVTSGSIVGSDEVVTIARDAGEAVGTYAMTFTDGAEADNYDISKVDGTFTINAKSITVTAGAAGKTYGLEDPQFTYVITSGTLNEGDELMGGISREAGEDVGTYALQSSLFNADYDITFVPANLTILKRDLTATADDKARIRGEANPELTITYQGFVNGDTGSDITEPTIATVADINSPIGTYDITLSGGTSNNYNINLVNGTLTVEGRPFITTWEITSRDVNQSRILFRGELDEGYAFRVDWGDGVVDPTLWIGGAGHTYTAEGTYTVTVTGQIPRFYTDFGGLKTVEQWGDNEWQSMEESFAADEVTFNATDVPDLSNVTSMKRMFYRARPGNVDLTRWDVSTITDMSEMFQESDFNGDISSWDVSSVTDMSYLFAQTENFDGDITDWNTASVQNMSYMFYTASVFNQAIDSWDVSSVTNMTYMFADAAAFNQDLNSWEVSKVTNMEYMFDNAELFNGNITGWDVSGVTDMSNMFDDAKVFNQDIDGWNVSNVTQMNAMFNDAEAFNQDLNSWNTSKVTNFTAMFQNTDVFNGAISNWDISNATQIERMFEDAHAFNHDIGSWEPTNAENLTAMFRDARVFNQDIGSWRFPNADRLNQMFYEAAAFDQDISSWETSNITDMSSMFEDAEAFNQNISGWDVSTVFSFGSMFRGTLVFNQDISGWDMSAATGISSMFKNAAVFNQDISGWTFADGERGLSSMSSVFENATAFDQDLSNWDVSNIGGMSSLFSNSGMSIASYDATLIGWAAQEVQNDVEFGVEGLQYCAGNAARQALITDHNWTIENDSQSCSANVTIADASGNEDDGNITVTLTSDAFVVDGFTVEVSTADGTAMAGTDYTAVTSQTITFAGTVGETQTFTITPTADTNVEGSESLTVSMSNLVTGTDNTVTITDGATITIIGDDEPMLGFATTSASNAESTSSAVVDITLDQSGLAAITVDYTVTGTATGGGTDYTLANGTLTFAAGDVSETISLSLVNDDIVETDETIIVTLSNASGASLGANTTFTYTIEDEDEATVSLSPVTASEGDGTVTLTATLDKAVDGGFTVDLITAESSAIKDVDYTGLDDVTLTFAGTVGETQSTNITLTDDEILEFEESISVLFDNLAGTSLNVSTGDVVEVTIEDNDQATVTIADVSQQEDGESFLVTATLDKAVVSGFTVEVSTADGTATIADGDYTSVSGTVLSFTGTAGETQTFDVSPVADGKLEADESFTVSMSNLAATTLPVTITDQATLTITNDDAAAVTLTDTAGNEGDGVITVIATLDNAVQGGFTVAVATADGSATVANSDYTAISGQTLSFNGTAGETQTFTVSPTNDIIIEGDETLTVTMSGLSTSLGVDISDGAIVTITNDDFNNAPTDVTLSATSIDENNALGATIGSFSTTDADAGDTHTYSLVTGTGSADNGFFFLEGNELKSSIPSFNFEFQSAYTIRVQTDDGKGGIFAKAIAISINDVNEAPFQISLSNNTIDESDEEQDVGMLMTLDPDAGETFTYAFVEGEQDAHNVQFEIVGNMVRTAGAIDFEEGATRDFRVRVTDSGGLTFEWAFTVIIEDVAAEPVRPFTQDAPGADVKNVFSPNGDGVNETWVIEDLLDNPFNEVKIFAQGGKLIYGKVNYGNDWAGTFRDNPVPDGTYYYEITIFENAQSTTPARVIKGFLTIIRNR